MVAFKEPWPKYGIDQYSKIEDGPWGYLILKDDGEFIIDDSIHPSENEILSRWAYAFDQVKQQ